MLGPSKGDSPTYYALLQSKIGVAACLLDLGTSPDIVPEGQ